MTLADALGVTGAEVVALVGGGGKSTAMFRLAREMVDKGGQAITTTTTKIFGAQIAARAIAAARPLELYGYVTSGVVELAAATSAGLFLSRSQK